MSNISNNIILETIIKTMKCYDIFLNSIVLYKYCLSYNTEKSK